MRKIVSVLSAAVLTLTLCACSSGSSSSSITVAGSTTCLPIAEIAAEGFKEETGIDVLVSGLGSSAGIEAVSAGTADIASSSRGLNADEQDLGLTPIVIAHDGIAVIVNDDNPVDNLSTEQLRDIYAGKITNWKEVGGEDLRIQVINRDEASGTREAFRTFRFGFFRWNRGRQRRHGRYRQLLPWTQCRRTGSGPDSHCHCPRRYCGHRERRQPRR